MYLIYNETERALKLNTTLAEDGTTTEFQVGIAAENGEFTVFNTITTITDDVYAANVANFCDKCTDITRKASRFYFRTPEGKRVSYDTKTCEVITYNKASEGEPMPEAARNPSNCIVMVLDKTSMAFIHRKYVSGHMPAKTINAGEYKILVFFARSNNWAKAGKDHGCVYVDGRNGKKQIDFGYAMVGPDKQYTTNSLREKDFEGEAFPEDTSRSNYKNKKRFDGVGNNRRSYDKIKGVDNNKVTE